MVTETAPKQNWATLYEAVRSMTTEDIRSDMQAADLIADENVRKAVADILHVMQEVLDEREYGMSFAGYGE
jgi:uncharacterized lipoprotein YajG